MNEAHYNPYAAPAADLLGASDDPLDRSSYHSERRSVWLLILLSVVTLSIYPGVWFWRRRKFLDGLQAGPKLGVLGVAPLMATVLSFLVSFVTTLLNAPPELDRAFTLPLGLVSVVEAFRVAAILRSDFARSGRSATLQVSGIATFFFSFLYLQHIINRAADVPARFPRVEPGA